MRMFAAIVVTVLGMWLLFTVLVGVAPFLIAGGLLWSFKEAKYLMYVAKEKWRL